MRGEISKITKIYNRQCSLQKILNPQTFDPHSFYKKTPDMPIINKDKKNTYLQTKVPNKVLPKIQEVKTLKTHL